MMQNHLQTISWCIGLCVLAGCDGIPTSSPHNDAETQQGPVAATGGLVDSLSDAELAAGSTIDGTIVIKPGQSESFR